MNTIDFSSQVETNEAIHPRDIMNLVSYIVGRFTPDHLITVWAYFETENLHHEMMTTIKFELQIYDTVKAESSRYEYTSYRAKDFSCSNTSLSKSQSTHGTNNSNE